MCTAQRIELLIALMIALMRRKAVEGGQILYLSLQPFENPSACGLVPLGSYPLRSTRLPNGRRGVPVGTKYRGADFVLSQVQPA